MRYALKLLPIVVGGYGALIGGADQKDRGR